MIFPPLLKTLMFLLLFRFLAECFLAQHFVMMPFDSFAHLTISRGSIFFGKSREELEEATIYEEQVLVLIR